MKATKIKQGTIEWLNAKHSRVGASEAFAIIRQYASDAELLSAGLQPEDVKNEVPYQSAYAIYNRIVNNVYLPNISIWDDVYGKAVESWVKSKFTVAPKSTVFMNKIRICSLDAHGGSGYPGIADNAIIEIKSRRGQVEDKALISWKVQNSLQCDAAENPDGYIIQVSLHDYSENMRGAVAKMYQIMPRKKFLSWFDSLEKNITIIDNRRDERLIALFDLCESRFWTDVKNKTAPIPTISEEKSKSCVQELLGTYYDRSEYNLTRYKKLSNLFAKIKDELESEKQKIFVHCVRNGVISVCDSSTIGTWDKAGAFRTKVAK